MRKTLIIAAFISAPALGFLALHPPPTSPSRDAKGPPEIEIQWNQVTVRPADSGSAEALTIRNIKDDQFTAQLPALPPQ